MDNNPSSGNANSLGSAQNVSVSAEEVPAADMVGDWIQPGEAGRIISVCGCKTIRGWKKKGRNIHAVMWVFPEMTPMDTFILISLNLASVCWRFNFFFYCLLHAELLKAPEIILFAHPYIYTSASNRPPDYWTCGSNSAIFQLKPNFSWRKGWTVVLIFPRPLGNVLRRETPIGRTRVQTSQNTMKCNR